MPSLFSYKTLSSVRAVAGRFSNVVVAGEIIRSSPVSRRGGAQQAVCNNGSASHKGAEASDGSADDQILHLVRAFVGVERFDICKEPPDVVVRHDAVTA